MCRILSFSINRGKTSVAGIVYDTEKAEKENRILLF